MNTATNQVRTRGTSRRAWARAGCSRTRTTAGSWTWRHGPGGGVEQPDERDPDRELQRAWMSRSWSATGATCWSTPGGSSYQVGSADEHADGGDAAPVDAVLPCCRRCGGVLSWHRREHAGQGYAAVAGRAVHGAAMPRSALRGGYTCTACAGSGSRTMRRLGGDLTKQWVLRSSYNRGPSVARSPRPQSAAGRDG